MCGIIGYSGKKDACDVVLSALTALEYRGYDSAGTALWENGSINLIKRSGKLECLKNAIGNDHHSSCCGIGHTRWATHGKPTEENAHPHKSGRVTLVHNGIIENYSRIKEDLENKGYTFSSQTDTEVAAAYIDSLYTGDAIKAIKTACNIFSGAYAFVILFSDRPGEVYGIRKGSPLIAACDAEGAYLASDLPAILPYTNKYYILEEKEIAFISNEEGIRFYDSQGIPTEKEQCEADWSVDSVGTEGYSCYMLKEINEQPRALHDTIIPRICDSLPYFNGELPDNFFANKKKITITACGTAYHAGMIGKYLIEKYARIPVTVDIASEFRYRNPIFGEDEAAIIISQSGETADTIAALNLFKENRIPTIAIVNVFGSSIAREADYCLYTYAGPEISVASTKAYSVQVALIELLAIQAAIDKGMHSTDAAKLTTELLSAINTVPEILSKSKDILNYAKNFKNCSSLFYIGRELDYAMALEGSLKLKEISYIHSEAYAAGELKHGTISLIVDNTPVIALATQKDIVPKTLSNVKEVQARGAKVCLITKKGIEVSDESNMDIFRLPDASDDFTPIVSVVVLQLLACGAAIEKGCNVDKPRNLAKSVTVE